MSLWFESFVLGFDHYLAIYTLSTFAIAISTLRRLGPDTNGSAVCTGCGKLTSFFI
jgi:hypothetical protein